MAASRTDGWPKNPVLVIESGDSRFGLPADQVEVRKNGVEFWSPTPFELWTEMGVAVDGSSGQTRCCGSAVVVSCEGDRHRGYVVSVLFLDRVPESHEPWMTANPTTWS